MCNGTLKSLRKFLPLSTVFDQMSRELFFSILDLMTKILNFENTRSLHTHVTKYVLANTGVISMQDIAKKS